MDDHPYADLLADMVKLARKITEAVRDDPKLHAYLSVAGLLTHDDVGQKGATLIALRGVYSLVKAAGEEKVLSEKAVIARYQRASGGWLPPLSLRRRCKKVIDPSGKLIDL